MANAFDQFDTPSQKNAFDQFDIMEEQLSVANQAQRRAGRESYGSDIAMKQLREAFTGEQRMTPTMESLDEIGAAPELNRMSVPAFKASFGLLATGETEPLKAILTQQLGEEVSFTEDEKGNPIVNLPSGQYALNKPGFSPQDVSRFAFDALSFTPAGRASSVPSAIGRATATEAAIEAGETGVGGEFDAEDVALAGGLGGGGKALEDIASSTVRSLRGTPDSAVVEAGEKFGVPVMTTDVLQPETFSGRMAQQTGEKIPFAGTGQKRALQQAAREQALDEVVQQYGIPNYADMVQSLKNQKDKIKSAAGSVLESTGTKLDEVGTIDLTNTLQTISDASVELSKPGVIKSNRALSELQTLMQAIQEAPQTFTSLKENRTAFREIIKGIESEQRSQMPSRAKSLLESVQKGMTKDMEGLARSELTPSEFSKWKKANQVWASESEKLRKTNLKNILDKGDIKPEAVESMLFSRKPSETNLLYKSLDNEGKKNARSAIISKVAGDLNRRQSGLTPNSFSSEMEKYGLQVDTFFKGEEKKQLEGFLELLKSTRRAQEAGVTTPTGQTLLGVGTGYAAFTDLIGTGATLGTIGGLSRIYESPIVRNALLRVASSPKGSSKYDEALSEAFQALTLSAQATRDELQETQRQQ